jgi:hypothetical protein
MQVLQLNGPRVTVCVCAAASPSPTATPRFGIVIARFNSEAGHLASCD